MVTSLSYEPLKHEQKLEIVKNYLHYKKITSQNVSSEAQAKNSFYFIEILSSVLKIFKFLYFSPSLDFSNL